MLPALALVTAVLGTAGYAPALREPALVPDSAPLPARTPANALARGLPDSFFRPSPARPLPALRAAVVIVPPSPATTPPAATAPATAPPPDPRVAALTEQRLRVQHTHYALGLSTWGATLTTAALGTIVAINQPTTFGTGLCMTDPNQAVFGTFGCSTLNALHEISAFVTVSLYTSTAAYALSMLRLDHDGAVSHRSAVARTMHQGVILIHLAAMLLTPVLGIIAANPGLVGVQYDPGDPVGSQARAANFQANINTAHLITGYVLVGSLTTAMLLEF